MDIDTKIVKFTKVMKQAVWNKARPIPGLHPALWRLDAFGSRMSWPEYGKRIERGAGWKVGYIVPPEDGGTDNFNNLHPLQWQNS